MKPGKICLLTALLLLGACTVLPSGPNVMVLPGTGKSFEQFRGDDASCRRFAGEQIGVNTPNQAAADSGVRSAALGAALGAVAGAAIDGSRGAAAGAGTGLLVGGLAGTGTGQASAYDAQRRYDYAYQQCMYASGHRIPVRSRFSTEPSPYTENMPPPPSSPSPSGNMPPPPPPGNPPPAPPGAVPR
ncbi:MAG: glycine zipper family protein [Proteobacteria bacterium]|nr:glycine zipper family protein [Pseudomonadota bacterium]